MPTTRQRLESLLRFNHSNRAVFPNQQPMQVQGEPNTGAYLLDLPFVLWNIRKSEPEAGALAIMHPLEQLTETGIEINPDRGTVAFCFNYPPFSSLRMDTGKVGKTLIQQPKPFVDEVGFKGLLNESFIGKLGTPWKCRHS